MRCSVPCPRLARAFTADGKICCSECGILSQPFRQKFSIKIYRPASGQIILLFIFHEIPPGAPYTGRTNTIATDWLAHISNPFAWNRRWILWAMQICILVIIIRRNTILRIHPNSSFNWWKLNCAGPGHSTDSFLIYIKFSMKLISVRPHILCGPRNIPFATRD